MNKLLLLSALAVLPVLASCGNKNRDPAEYVKAENFTVYTSTAAPQTPLETLTETAEDLTKEYRFQYALNGTSVELRVNDVKIKTLDYYYTPDEKCISVADFDFDGYDDIFIPYENSSSGYGYYYCYIPVKNDFALSDALMDVNRIMTVNTEDKTLTEEQNDGYTHRTIIYKWEGNRLEPTRKTETYKSYNDGKMHTDTYSYDSKGNEVLEGELIEEVPSETETAASQ